MSAAEAVRYRSTFLVSKMDCPSEENLIRMALSPRSEVSSCEFDLARREVTLVHEGQAASLLDVLQPLGIGASLRQSTPLADEATQLQTTFNVQKMDCAAEENIIRLALRDLPGVQALSFDLPKRQLSVRHSGSPDTLLQRLQRLQSLGLGAVLLVESIPMDGGVLGLQQLGAQENESEARTLKALLGINGAMFIVELVTGLFAQSTGLIADSLDMFADAAVYGLALYAVGRAAALKLKAAHVAGWLQLALALGALAEVIRRFMVGSDPQSAIMVGMGLLALTANVACLVLISKKRDRGAHMTASYIFSANDVIANAGVIAAGVLVAMTGSRYPDLLIGSIIAVVVLNGARRILKLR